jgi:hypothetical protein
MVVGMIGFLFYALWLIVLAFKKSFLWGLGWLFIPFVSLVFVYKHWLEVKKPFLISVGFLLLYIAGGLYPMFFASW